MKKPLQRLFALLLCLCMLFSLAATAMANTSSAVQVPKKIISVVYDDSSSMEGDAWVYANYAMQALIALLNEQDELYITFMSDYGTSVAMDLNDIEGTVQIIRNWTQEGGTPPESVDTAKAQLDSISETDATAQFWLFVMTDGGLYSDQKDLQNKLDSLQGAPMSNGTGLNVVYLAMGSSALTAQSGGSLHAFEAGNNDAISSVMGDVSNLISGRITADNVQKVDDQTYTFTSDLPLYSISVLSQQSSATVTGAKASEGTLNVYRSIPLDASEPFGTTSLNLFGNASVLNLRNQAGENQVIPAGSYTITFSEPVELSDLTIQYEPAIGLKAVITREGIEITDTSELVTGDKVSIEIIPVIPGTDEPIDVSKLPGTINWKIEYEVDDSVVASNNSNQLDDVEILMGRNMIRGTMQIPGFAPSVYEIFFEQSEIVYNLGLEVDQPDPLSYYRRYIRDGSIEGGAVTFWLTNDGQRLTQAEVDQSGAKLEVVNIECDNSNVTGFLHTFGKVLAGAKLVENGDGSYSLKPTGKMAFTAFLTMAGDYTVDVALVDDPSIQATGKFTMVPLLIDWLDLLILILIVCLLIYLIYIIFIKYKFKGQTVRYEAYRIQGDGTGVEMRGSARSLDLKPLSGHFLLPTRACYVNFQGLRLEAGPDGMVTITGKSIAKRVCLYGASGSDPTESMDTIIATMRSTVKKDGKREASDQTLSSRRPLYFRSTETDKLVWCLYLKK